LQVRYFVQVSRTDIKLGIDLPLLYLRPSAWRQEKGASLCVQGRQAVRRPSSRLHGHKANNSSNPS
jgi:hypothetical protein